MSDQKQKIIATSAGEWRSLRKDGFPYRFLSGKIAIVRPVSLVELFSFGEIPENLIQLAYNLTVGNREDAKKEPDIEEAKKAMNRLKELLGIVAKAAFISPKVVVEETEVLDDDTITLSDITFEDSMEMLVVVQYPAQALERFRQEQENTL